MLGVLTMQPASATARSASSSRWPCSPRPPAAIGARVGSRAGVLEQDSGEYEGLGRKAFEVLKQVNGALIQGNFRVFRMSKRGHRVLLHFQSALYARRSMQRETVSGAARWNRVVKYEVSFASLSPALHGEAHGDLVIAPRRRRRRGTGLCRPGDAWCRGLSTSAKTGYTNVRLDN